MIVVFQRDVSASHQRDSYLEEVEAEEASDLAKHLDLEEAVEKVNDVLADPWAEDIQEYGYGKNTLDFIRIPTDKSIN